jgi:hypothetical protein
MNYFTAILQNKFSVRNKYENLTSYGLYRYK